MGLDRHAGTGAGSPGRSRGLRIEHASAPPPACRYRVSPPVSHALFLELRILQSSETWREAVARSRYDTECPLSVGSRTIDYSDGGYGVTIVGSNVTAIGTGQSWRNRYLEVRGHGSGAVIIPFVGESILFERHYRVATDEFSWELPRGFGETDETDAETARRELREETGLLADDVTVISRIHADAGIMNDDIAVVATRSGSIDYLTPEHSWESMGFALVPVAELDDFIAEAGVNDAITLAALRLLVTMSAAKIRPIRVERRHEDGPYGDTIYEKPTFDELDRFGTEGDIEAVAPIAESAEFNPETAYASYPGDDIMSKFNAASQNLDDLSAALEEDDQADEYTFDIDDGDDGDNGDSADTGFGYIDGDDDGGYKTVIGTDGDGLPDTLADIDYGDSIGDGRDSDGLSDDDFDFDGDRGDPLGYRFDVDDEQPPAPTGIGGWDTDIDDIDDDDAAYEALFGEPRRHGGEADGHADAAEPQGGEPAATAAAESPESSRTERPVDMPDNDDEDYLEGDDDDAPADIETGNDPILDDEESDRLKNLIAEFSARHAGEIPGGNGSDAERKPETVGDEETDAHEQDEADGSDGEAAGDTGSHDMDDAAATEADMDDEPEPETVAGTDEDGTDGDELGDAEDDADGDATDGAEGGEVGESNLDDSDANDDDQDNDDDDADDGWDDDEDVYSEDGDQDDQLDDEPSQPLPPMWATEVVTSSTAKPEQIGDVVKYLASGDRSKVGRLIVNFGRREFFIKPIDPDERVMRLDSGNVTRICDGGLVDFDSDEYEQRLKELIKSMIGGGKREEPAETASEKEEKAPEDDDKDASTLSAPGDEKGGKADTGDVKADSGDAKIDDEEDDGDEVFNSILEDIDVDGLNGIGDMDELFDGRDAETGSDDSDTAIDVTPEDMDDMF